MNKNIVDTMFVDLFLRTNLKGLINNNQEIVKRCHEIKQNFTRKVTWHCDTYSSLKTYKIADDELFKPLIDLCSKKVKDFAKEYGFENCDAVCTGSWFNIASPGHYQEFHIHPQTHFSVVYYSDVDVNTGKIFF